MNFDNGIGEIDNCERNLGVREGLRRLIGHPVLLHLVNGQNFRGIVLNVTENAVRLISNRGCRTLIPLLHISAIREPQLGFDVRCIREVGSCGNMEESECD